MNVKDYKFSILNNIYTVKDENELALIFEILSWENNISSIIHWNIIMELDENLVKIIVSYKWLLSCLKILDENNSFLFLIKIWDILSKIINKSEQLWEILSRISQEKNKLRILKQIRSIWLQKIILNSNDLCNVLEWIFDNTEKELLEMLWKEYILNTCKNVKEIYNILHYLNNNNKDFLIELISLKTIKSYIYNMYDLLFMIKWITIKQAKLLLKMYSKKEIKWFFKNNEEFNYFLLKLSEQKEKIFLKNLWL